MPRPTKAQLTKINKFAHAELTDDQVYVFRSLSADTLPVARHSWYGPYSINMSSAMLNALKKSYQTGVGLLASHNNNRLPFGRTFDAEVTVDHVSGDSVETMYVDHYVVTHMKDEDGNKIPLRTEINGMTTQDIVNHIDVGHTFDTSIGFAITKPTCSICKNDIRDYENCSHVPGRQYDVQVDEKAEKVTCNILAEDGEGLENSLVYAGAVDRAIITHSTPANETFSEGLQGAVNNGEPALYNVDDIKTVPLHSQLLCRMAKGNMEIFTSTSERKNINQLKGSEEMTVENTQPTPEATFTTGEALLSADVVSLEQYNKVVEERENFSKEATLLQTQLDEATDKLAISEAENVSLQAKSELADKFTKDLVGDVVKAGVQARGNGFNPERYAKYAETLSVDELKEELTAFKSEFPGSVEEARVTAVELQEGRDTGSVVLSKSEMRQLAATNAMEIYKTKGGNLEELTKSELAKLQAESK